MCVCVCVCMGVCLRARARARATLHTPMSGSAPMTNGARPSRVGHAKALLRDASLRRGGNETCCGTQSTDTWTALTRSTCDSAERGGAATKPTTTLCARIAGRGTVWSATPFSARR